MRNVRKKFDNFEEHLQWVRTYTATNPDETEEDREKRRQRARRDYGFFVSTYFPHYATSACARFHIKAANLILKYPYLRIVLAWFRGAAKSVHSNIFIPMWLKIQQPREIRKMVLVGKNYDTAKELLSDLQAELQANDLFTTDYGQQMQLGSWEDGKFMTKDGCSFTALGIGQSPRGLRKRENRPDYIVVDDIDDDETVRNERRVDNHVDWIDRSLTLTMDMGRGRMIFSNNLIHDKSIISKLVAKYKQLLKELKELGQDTRNPKSTHYHISQVNIKDTKGRITWPEKYTDHDVKEIELELGYAVSQTELYNNPIQEGRVFKQDWMQFAPIPRLSSFADVVCYYDGGWKKTATSDTKSLVCIGILKGQYWILKAYCAKATRMEAVDWHYDLYAWLQDKKGSARWFMEEAFMLDQLYDDFKDASVSKGFPIPLMGDKRQKPNKDLRIESLAGGFERGAFWFNKQEETSYHMKNLVEQFLAFESGKNVHKDGPDAVEGGCHLLKERVVRDQPAVVGKRKRGRYQY